jgi:predicted ATPase/DNA-binding response OmpR family regulator
MLLTITGTTPSERPELASAFASAGFEVVEAPWRDHGDFAGVVVADLRALAARADDIGRWKAEGVTGPILVLARPGGAHLRALHAGADDYLVAPFSPGEVAERAIALAHRHEARLPERVHLADGFIDLDSRLVERGDRTARLTATEARLVAFLARHPDGSFSREQLQVRVWGYRAGIKSRTVFSTMRRLRMKLEADPGAPAHLVTERDGRYRLISAGRHHPGPTKRRPTGWDGGFVGRERELAEATRLLRLGRVVTLVGPGGIGKTRIAIEIAARLGAELADGPVVVELAAVDDQDLLPAVARALGLAVGPDLMVELATALRTRRGLLVLDNLEHLASAAEQLGPLLAERGDMAILCTSRVPLRVSDEALVALDGLDLDNAVSLFEIAVARSGGEIRGDERPTAARIAARLERVPLALLLAASWTHALSLDEIEASLGRDLSLLDEGPRDLPPRHRSLRSVFEGSWALLSTEQRRQLEALAAFHAPFERDAAHAIAGMGLVDLLRLVDASLLRRDGPRFSLHPLLSELVRERLEASPASEAVRDRHLAWFGAELRRRGDGLMALELDDLTDARNVEPIWGDLWACWCRAAEKLDADVIVWGMYPMIRRVEGSPRMGTIIEPLLRALPPEDPGEPDPVRLLRALGLAMLAGGVASRGEATGSDYAERAVGLVSGLTGPNARHVHAFTLLARQIQRLYWCQEGLAECQDYVEAMRTSGNEREHRQAKAVLALFAAREASAADARAAIDAAFACLPPAGRGRGPALMYLGMAEVELGRWAAGRELLTAATADLQRDRETVFPLWTAMPLSWTEAQLGLDQAVRTARDALEDCMGEHYPPAARIGPLASVALVWARSGRTAEALRLASLVAYHPAVFEMLRRFGRRVLAELTPVVGEAELARARRAAQLAEAEQVARETLEALADV